MLKAFEFKIKLPLEWLRENESEKDLQERFKILLVLDKVRRQEISAAKGAAMLKIHLSDFVKLMSEYGLCYLDYPEEDIKEELQSVKDLSSRLRRKE